MDITETLVPDSQQLDAVDLASGPRTFTITEVDVKKGTEQPVTVHLAEFPRPWKPGKTMRRVLAGCLSPDSSTWPGHRVRLWCDGRVTFGKDEVGGVRITHITGIDSPRKVPVIITKGRSGMYPVHPLDDATYLADLKNEWRAADPERRKAIEAEAARLSGTPAADDPDADYVAAVQAQDEATS